MMPGQTTSISSTLMSALLAANNCRYSASASVPLLGGEKVRTLWPVWRAQASAWRLQNASSLPLLPQAIVKVAAGAAAAAVASASAVRLRRTNVTKSASLTHRRRRASAECGREGDFTVVVSPVL